MQNKILIANRGEIAVRIIRAAKELGIPSVAVYSTADKDSLHVKLADESICVGSSKSVDSYLNIKNILSAAISTGCNAVHPGYGFLSENDKFVSMLERCGIIFIGPNSEDIRQLGNKSTAREIAKAAGLPVVKGSCKAVETLDEAIQIAKSIEYPIMIKAVSGGGGKGINIIKDESELTKMYDLTKMEASANFGDSSVYVEKFIENPHHIEIQVIADNFGNVVHLGERDCSVQRRNQKLIEESPSPFISEALRNKLGEEAVKLVKHIGYKNVGTVEFLVDKFENHYFMEMNTRIQVEHPVTEMITGIDLVKEQIKIAYNNHLSFTQDDVKMNGHVIECRINAEDFHHDFRPSPGIIKNLVLPGGFGVRVDTHIYGNYEVPPYYDSLLAKLIVHAPTRKEAIKKMRVALEQFIVTGIKTNIEIQYLIMHNTFFVRGIYDTSFIKQFWETIKGEI